MTAKYKRVLLKLSGEYLGGPSGVGFDFDVINGLTDQIIAVHDLGIDVSIVLGGGNFFRGTQSVPIDIDRVAADHIGMMATVMNGVCVKEALVARGKTAFVMTGLEMPSVAEPFSKAKAIQRLNNREILMFAGGTGNPFFSTDTAAVLRALEIEADIVIKGTKVNGVFDRDPMKDPAAIRYESLTFSEVLEKDLKVMDAAAIALCRENHLPLGILDISTTDDLIKFITGEQVGSMIHD